jgi:3-phosphoglycerate kinase
MELPTIKKLNCKGKNVLARAGFDVPIKNGKVAEDFRIVKSLPTIRLLKSKGAKIILLSHLGEDKLSLKPVANYLCRHLRDFKFIPSLSMKVVEKAVSSMKEGDIIMLENLRREKGEEKNDKNFAKKLADLGDIYVNEAFSVSHREHVSIVGIPKYLPSFAGLLFEKEVKNLSKAFKPKHPFLLILGGVKFESKLGVLEKFLKIADKIFIGGALANNFFILKGMKIDKSLIDKKVPVKKYLHNKKIILPADVRRKNGKILDIGPKAIKELFILIKKAKFILWNGPLGNTDMKDFEKGTEMVARKIAENGAVSIIGGGDTVAAAMKFGVSDRFSFVSTGGGAMLQFLAKGTLPGIEALKKSQKIK